MTEKDILQNMEQSFSKIFAGTQHEVILGSTCLREINMKDFPSDRGTRYIDTKGNFTEQEVQKIMGRQP